jgi:hypothetical protein
VDHLVESGQFKESGHDNPGSMPYKSAKFNAKNVTLGAFKHIPDQIEKIGSATPMDISGSSLEHAPKRARPTSDGVVYIGDSSDSPRIGDERITFKVVKPGPVSVIAQQVGSSFQAYQTKAGDALLLVQDGIRGPNEMFQKALEDNTVMTWILRAVGFFMMFIGLAMVFKPLSVLGDVIPFVGSMIGAGMGLFAFLISVGFSLLTVAIAWIFYRPLLGVPLLLLAGGALYLVFARGRKRKVEGGGATGAARAA